MSRYIIQEESLTSIADEIRILSGIEDTISPGAMETKLQEANTNVNIEANLIEQIQTVLYNKTNVEDVTPEVNVYTEELKNLNAAITALELELRKKTNVDVEINILTKKLSSNGTSISFTGLTKEPKMFAISPTGNITLGSTRYVTSVMYDGDTTRGTYGYRSSSSATSYHSASYFTWTYSNGTLTVKTSSSTNGGNFSSSVTYQLAYVVATEGSLGGSAGDMQLPTLTNAGVASDLALGKQLIDGSGNIVTGTHECATGGVTVQRYPATNTGSVRISGTDTTVNCGFKPDAVFFFGTHPQNNNSAMHAGVAFTEANVTKMSTLFTPPGTSYAFSSLSVTQTSTGFKINGVRIDTSFDVTNESYRNINYVAIKYTE